MITTLAKKVVGLVASFFLLMAVSCATSDQQQVDDDFDQMQEEDAQFEEQVEEADTSSDSQPEILEEAQPAESEIVPAPEPLTEEGRDLSLDLNAPETGPVEGLGVQSNEENSTAGELQTAAEGHLSYVVRPGDTLSKIARVVFGDLQLWEDIHRATPSIKDPNLIFPGEVIHVPLSTPAAKEFATRYTSGKKTVSVTVKAGDTLSKIAASSLGSADMWKVVYEENQGQISNPDIIAVGQVLTITVHPSSSP